MQFLQAWEMHPYCRMAAEAGYKVLLMEPSTPWRRKTAELARRTRHGVPKDKIALMASRMDDGIASAEDVCGGLPPNFKPVCTSLDEIVARRLAKKEEEEQQQQQSVNGAVVNGEAAPEDEVHSDSSSSASGSGKSDKSSSGELADFQSLIQCFPDQSLDSLYLNFIKVILNVMLHKATCKQGLIINSKCLGIS